MTEIDWTHYFFAIAILAMLLGGLGLFSHAVRKGWILQNMTGLRALTQGHRRRLALKETLVIDPRRRLVILQADDMEHVVLLGAEAETILSSQAAPAEPAELQETAS
ncbi:flagellar biosynthetic protein FliO [Maricaulis alexandrii]|jgi:flagellar protein FliO/FliZ|uniref:flagellar biosynthetic protein FliO n=1 Tax=Maricaulis alexandrii TaxID=2570354 RepID=UPI001109D50B|nr:flagellar biosynthetic protein FliO [Maricaulis alexandrii]